MKVKDLYTAGGILVIAIVSRLFKSILLYIFNLLLNHIQQLFLYYQVLFLIPYSAETGVHISISIIYVYAKVVNQTIFLVLSFNKS